MYVLILFFQFLISFNCKGEGHDRRKAEMEREIKKAWGSQTEMKKWLSKNEAAIDERVVISTLRGWKMSIQELLNHTMSLHATRASNIIFQACNGCFLRSQTADWSQVSPSLFVSSLRSETYKHCSLNVNVTSAGAHFQFRWKRDWKENETREVFQTSKYNQKRNWKRNLATCGALSDCGTELQSQAHYRAATDHEKHQWKCPLLWVTS